MSKILLIVDTQNSGSYSARVEASYSPQLNSPERHLLAGL